MAYSRSIQENINRLTSFKDVVETYGAIAASSLRQIRNSVLQNRAFHYGLSRIFQDIKRASRVRIQDARPGNPSLPPVVMRNGKTGCVLLSANAGLYGDIIARTIQLFVNEIKKTPCDPVVIGRVGKAVVQEMMPGVQFQYFDFPDNQIARDSFKAIAKMLAEYERVFVFHALFKNFLSQEPQSTSVSGEGLASESTGEKEASYLFEPSLETLRNFFETEIFASLLEQVFYESRLAKVASRMVLLDRSTGKIDFALVTARLEERRQRHRRLNRKQLDALAGIRLWGIS